MSTKHLSPAEYVIATFEGVRATARALGRSPSAVFKWKEPRESRGCGGRIPSGVHHKILERARALDLDITTNDLIMGREVPIPPQEEPNAS